MSAVVTCARRVNHALWYTYDIFFWMMTHFYLSTILLIDQNPKWPLRVTPRVSDGSIVGYIVFLSILYQIKTSQIIYFNRLLQYHIANNVILHILTQNCYTPKIQYGCYKPIDSFASNDTSYSRSLTAAIVVQTSFFCRASTCNNLHNLCWCNHQ